MVKKTKKIFGAHTLFFRTVRTAKPDQIHAILLYKRTQDALTHPGYWALFGGTSLAGEAPRQTILREIKEELEVSDKAAFDAATRKIKLLCKVKILRGREGWIHYFCAPLNVDMDALRMKRNEADDKVEGEGMAWFTAEEINHLMMRPEDRIAIAAFLKERGI